MPQNERFSRKHERLIKALLNTTSNEAAAKVAGISPATLYRYLNNERFREAYRRYRRQALEQALSQAQVLASEAIDTLRSVMKSGNKESARVSAAREILSAAVNWLELADVEERLSQLEEAAEAQRR